MMRVLFFVLSLCIISSCNTVQGFGKDIENAGEAINDTAGNVKKKIDD